MKDAPGRRTRGGLAGGAVLALITVAAVLVTITVLRGTGLSAPSPLPATSAAPAGSSPQASDPAPPVWDPMEPQPSEQGVTGDTGPGAEPGDLGSAGVEPGYPAAPTGSLPSPKATATAYSFVAVAGNGCAETASSGAYAAFTAEKPVSSMSGGWTGTGCASGGYWSVPMSGRADRDDPLVHVTWWFATTAVHNGTCAIWLYVPKPDRETEAAGKPSTYQVLRDRENAAVLGTFTIDQVASRGSWTFAGSYPMTDGRMAVRLVNRGTGAGGARHAGAQVQVGCSA